MIRILHLSDLHFGNHNRFGGVDPEDFGKSFHHQLEQAREKLGMNGQVDLVLVTGDIAEVGKPKEFEQGRLFLNVLVGELGLEHRRFVFVPGNHDVSRPRCVQEAAQQDIEDFSDDELRQRMDAVKLHYYDQFVENFYGTPQADVAVKLTHGAYQYNFSDLRLSVAALNSCERESHRAGDHVGEVSEAQAQTVMQAWHAEPASSWLKIVAVHHNPLVTVPANIDWWRKNLKGKEMSDDLIAAYEGDVLGLKGKRHLKAIVEDCQAQLVLHGHQHAQDRNSWPWRESGHAHVLSAGSLCLSDDKLPGTEPASCRLIELDDSAPEIRVASLEYQPMARAKGQVSLGAFTAVGPKAHRLDLPDGYEVARKSEKKAAGEDTDHSTHVASFVRTYRRALAHVHSRWDLATAGVAQSGGAGRPIEATLDAMYLPLRLGKGFDPEKLELGRVVGPEDLLNRQRPLAIRGAAGSGKTTWTRWTFRRLLSIDRALPLMLVLRDLARHWQDLPRGVNRSLERYLECWVAEHMGTGWEGELKRFLAAQEGPRPVLLVDGWDEVGALGEELRQKLLGLMQLYPRLLVVVTSRPYGEGRPAGSEGFEVLDIQPLDDGEIASLAERFFRLCYGEDESEAERRQQQLIASMARSPDAQALARTALLLTMMLLVSRSRPLPDKRHALYEACLDNLLTALPDRKTEEGAQALRHQWRPDEAEERWRRVAELAFRLQKAGYKSKSRSQIVAPWQQLAGYLPKAWDEKKRHGFLAWLAGPAGILVDRADDTLTFAHLSFQEYLAAWHLNASVEGAENRVAQFGELLGDGDWWETLLLWAALIEKPNPQRLDPVLAELSAGDQGLCLAGLALADGLGSEAAFSIWLDRLTKVLRWRWLPAGYRLIQAWKATQQKTRRAHLASTMAASAASARWLEWYRLDALWQIAGGRGELEPPEEAGAQALIARKTETLDENSVSVGRLLSGGPSFWPHHSSNIGFLHLWPGHRRLAGLRLQSIAVCGGEIWQWPVPLHDLLSQPVWGAQQQDFARDFASYFASDFARYFASDFARYFARDLASDLARDLASDFARYFARYLASYLARDFASDLARYLARYFASYLARYFAHYLARDFASDLARDLASDFARDLASDFARDLVSDFARYFARDFASDFADSLKKRWQWRQSQDWMSDFANMELMTFGRSAGRALLGGRHRRLQEQGIEESKEEPLLDVLTEACAVSLNPSQSTDDLERALDQHSRHLNPLWSALARHLARCSSDQDRQLLTDLARDPEQVEDGPLRWGLRYIVRGDVRLEDGTVLTLDELADRAGVPHLPYLEDLPDELEF